MKLLLIALLMLLTACSGGRAVAPVGAERSGKAPPAAYVVKKGDTLYSISFRYGLDYREVARKNRIKSPYTIYVGQKLRFVGVPVRATRTAQKSVKQTTTRSQTIKQSTRASTTTKPAATPTKVPAKTTSTPSPTKVTTTSTTQDLIWRWPTQGPILSSFSESSPARKGIIIGGKAGQNVDAAASGRVVYSGNGLPRYGNLLIIKHNDVYLSAYAHNQSLLVKEGQEVRVGQKIATLGRTGTQRDQLHFEIRRNGKPLDPTRFLPKQ